MEFLFNSWNIANIPLSAIVMYLLSLCLSVIPVGRLFADLLTIILLAGAVAVALIAGVDMLLIAAFLLFMLTIYVAFYIRRRKGE